MLRTLVRQWVCKYEWSIISILRETKFLLRGRQTHRYCKTQVFRSLLGTEAGHLTQSYEYYRASVPFHITSFWMGPVLLKSIMVLQALLVEPTSFGEISPSASKLGWAPAMQTCFPKANSSVQDPVLASALTWAFVLDSVVLTSRGYLAMCLSAWLCCSWLHTCELSQPATHVPCVWAFLYDTCHPETWSAPSVQTDSVSSLAIARVDYHAFQH